MLIADWLSIQMLVGAVGAKPSSLRMARRHLACLAAVTAARNSASVELVAVDGFYGSVGLDEFVERDGV